MRKDIERLHDIASHDTREIIGLMSGTSLDGLDVAWCSISGTGVGAQIVLKQFHTEPYDDETKERIRAVFAKKEIDFQHFTLLNVYIAELHARIVLQCLERWGVSPAEIDLIASHGQTVFHAPRVFHQMPNEPNATLQIGDGDHIARRTGILTLSDFRQKHVAAGGEGAPLALYGDYFLFASPSEHRFLLNIGGIANFTWLPAGADPAKVFATDTGPGNTLLDTHAQVLFGVPYDKDALIAQAGETDPYLLGILHQEAFFGEEFPKTIGPELFSYQWVRAAMSQIPKGTPAHNPYNLMATLTRLTAETIAMAIKKAHRGIEGTTRIYLSGGGAHNPLIVGHLKELLPDWELLPMEVLGIPGDAKEAVLFAMLANECVAGKPNAGVALGGLPLMSMGKISLPE